MCGRSALPLSQLEVLVVDCQATAPAPHGHLLELGWGRDRSSAMHARLIALPTGERIPRAVARITGISERMMRQAVDARVAWRELSGEAAMLTQQPAPTIIHFARFEQPFLLALSGGVLPLDLVCTHEIARRLLPDLPRCGLRALAGYFGRSVGALRRSTDHVRATAFIWRELVDLLDAQGVSTWSALQEWLAAPPAVSSKRPRRAWPMPRDVRLSLPDAPGIYRMLRKSGDILYIGKATSLYHRVNSYFRKQCGIPERMLEMLSQARAISVEITPSALEAALLEPDEIKRHRPPYNIALTADDRAVWFASADLSVRSLYPSTRYRLGPFPSAEELDQFRALARADRAALAHGRWGPDSAVFRAGYMRLCGAHRELSRTDVGPYLRLLWLGTRLWRDGRRDRDSDEEGAAEMRRVIEWTPELVQVALERLVLHAALARRRAMWLTRLFDATVVWTENGTAGARLIVIENGEVVLNAEAESGCSPPTPPGFRRPVRARHHGFSLASFDRLRVLTSELKRLVAAGVPVAVRFGENPPLADARLACALSWL